MAQATFADELARYGPNRNTPAAVTAAQAQAYCRKLTARHYENFTVASWLLPKRLRPHFYSIYAYCRWADDLADETGDSNQSLELLDWWEAQLFDCFERRSKHPVFVALEETINEFEIPPEPFLDLLVAFRQDQHRRRYETRDELLEYCRYSANPVGRLVLYLGRCHDQECELLSDQVCTGLQLANFLQDVARDWDAGRVYLPQEVCRANDYDQSCFHNRLVTDGFRKMMATEVDQAEVLLQAGLPLAKKVPAEIGIDVELFARGGLAILDGIRSTGYDVWRRRPTVSKAKQIWLLTQCWTRHRVARRLGAQS